MDYSEQKKFFKTAYATGSDSWTNTTLPTFGSELTAKLAENAMVLDLGSGRGRFPFELAHEGFKVIGLEYIKDVVDKNNKEVKNFKLESKLRFIEGDVFDIPLTDESFDAVADIGLLQHIHPEEWTDYRAEVVRILKSGGYYFLITLSKGTPTFFNWHPKRERSGDFDRDGVYYHFFTNEELTLLFENDFETISEHTEKVDMHGDTVVFLVTLLRKK